MTYLGSSSRSFPGRYRQCELRWRFDGLASPIIIIIIIIMIIIMIIIIIAVLFDVVSWLPVPLV